MWDSLERKILIPFPHRYNVSKLLQLYTVRELARLISGSAKSPTVVLNISNPGFCRSNIMREATGLWLLFIEGMKFVLSRTTEVGSRTLVAGAEGGLQTHGQYLNDGHPDKYAWIDGDLFVSRDEPLLMLLDRVAPLVDSPEGNIVQQRVWEELSQKLETIQPGILKNI